MKTWYVTDTESGLTKQFPSELDCAFFVAMVQEFFPVFANGQTLTYFWREE